MFYLKNLTSNEVFHRDSWDFSGVCPVPQNCYADKSARTRWLQDPKTDYIIYSLYEGVNPNLRLKGPSGEDEGNPPVKLWGIVADYDLPIDFPEVEIAVARMGQLKPNYYEKSLSGYARLIWLFSESINLPSYAFTLFLLNQISDIIPVKAMAGLDAPALLAPDRYFAAGLGFTKIQEAPVPADLMRAFLMKLSAKYDWEGESVTVPLDVVSLELKKKYPRFASWPKLELGAQGCTFWVDASRSPLSAICRETGMQTFSGSAAKSFFTWSELISAEFVNQYKQKQLGSATENIFFDEKSYFSKLPDGSWGIDPKENIALSLKVNKGLSDRTRKGENSSEIEQALAYIQRHNRVKTAASFAFYKEGLIEFNGARCLNLHTRKALPPAPGPVIWGPDGHLPWLSKFLDTLFYPQEQLPHFMAWWKYFYTSCYLREPRSGHAIFIAGGVNTGKTFLSRAVVAQLCGGFAEANSLLMQTETFNSESFDVSTWVLDDATVSLDARSHKRFSEQVKRVCANPTHRCNGKFLKAVQIKWQGRVICTLNTDSESLRLIPDLDLSLREKVMIFRTVSEPAVQFLPQAQMEDMLKRELPYLARFLLDMEYPDFTLSGDPRFHCVAYHEQTLTTNANHASNSSAFAEILADFLKEYFQREPNVDAWVGTGLALQKQILADPTMEIIMRPYNSGAIGRAISSLAGKGLFDITFDNNEFSREFTISRGKRFTKRVNGARVTQAENSIFAK